jgi:hypothetical protein
MALIQSSWAKGVKALPVSGEAGGVVAERFEINLADLPTLVVNDVLELAGLPAFHTIVGYTLDNDEVDAATAITVDVGIMSGEFGVVDSARTCGNQLFAASTALRTAAVTVGNSAAAFRLAPTDKDRGIGLKFTGIPAGGNQRTTGVLALTVLYKQ